MLRLIFELEPRPQPRPRFNRSSGRAYEDKTAQEYKAAIGFMAKAQMQGAPPFETPVKVSLRFYRRYAAHSRRFGDTDNLIKAILDGLNDVVWRDDSLIVSLTAEKIQSSTGKIEVEIAQVL